MPSNTSILKVLIYRSNNKIITYQTENQTSTQQIISSIPHPNKIFSHPVLLTADNNSISAIRLSNVFRVDIISDNLPQWPHFHGTKSSRVITDDEFNTSVAQLPVINESVPLASAGTILKGYMRLDFINASNLNLEIEMEALPSVLPFDLDPFFTKLFESSGMHSSLPDGGLTIINPALIDKITFYPKPGKLPAKSWLFD